MRGSFTQRCALSAVLTMVAFCVAGAPATGQAQGSMAAGAPNTQKSFASAREASEALIQAAEKHDTAALLEIFGPDGKDLVVSGDPVQDKNRTEAFVSKAREQHAIVVDSANLHRATLVVGNDHWPFPVPIVQKLQKWHFDTKAGRDEILFRRIGANELDAIQVCLGFVEAQKEYAADIHDNSGVNQYAQKIISTPGKHDGLYWKNPDGSAGGPIGEAAAKAINEGYSVNQGTGYHGYFFRVLKGQGPAAPLGELDYVIEGVMIGGFALLASPVEYGVTGVKTFMVSNDGVVYQKDLGANTLALAEHIERYNPDATWQRTHDHWPLDEEAANR